ncbi:MAG: glycoside hydrolase domain-containing protein, partial [Armatimonadota bacterium]
ATLMLAPEGADGSQFTETATVPAGGETAVSIPYLAGRVGQYEAALAIEGADEALYAARFNFSVPELHRSDFGYAISSDDATDLWWCESTYKVNRERPAPTAEAATVRLAAARGEFEPVQVVLRPKQALSGLTASISDLSGDGGAIPASAVDILRVGYVFVHTPTDSQGAVGWWPDPLPPLDEPLDLEAGQNQPLWLRVEVPTDAAPGDYEATLTLEADGWSAEVPLELRVWDFEMPAERSIVATMGLRAAEIKRYHHLETDEQMEEVFDAYMQSFRDHRIDPYHPWLTGPRVELVGVTWDGGDITAAEDAPEGEHVLRVVDEDSAASPSAGTVNPMPIDRTQAHRLSFMARAEENHIFQTTLGCRDADGNWMSGRNIDDRHTGTGAWERYSVEIPPARIAEGCEAVTLTLRPTRWVEEGTPTGTVWFDDVSLRQEGREGNLIADGGFEDGPDGAHIEVDFAEWDRWLEKYVDGAGFESFRLPISYMPRRDAPGRVGPYEQGSAAYDRIVGEYLHTLQEHLRDRGWLDEAYAYWVDEPAPEHYENVRYGMRLLDEYAPDIRRMLTEQPEPELVDFVDIWCPVLHNYVEEIARERQAAGDEIWWYVCTGPKAPWAGLFTDHNAIDLRIWQWMSWKYDVSGSLVWATNYWYSPQRVRETGEYQNPWEDPMSYRSSGGGWWGNGDGRFLYPPDVDPNTEHEPILSGPIDSIRWEMLREGLEDYEYFAILSRLAKQSANANWRELLTIPPEIVESPREFTRDPQPLYARRAAIAEAIERLGE